MIEIWVGPKIHQNANFAQNSRYPEFRKCSVFHEPETSLQQLTITHRLKRWVPRGFLTTLQTHPNSPKLTRWVQPLYSNCTPTSRDLATHKRPNAAHLLKIVEHPVFRKFLQRTRISKKRTRNDLLRSAATAGKRWKLWNKPKNKFCFSILEDTIFLSDDEDDRDPDLTKIDQNGKFCSDTGRPIARRTRCPCTASYCPA